MRNSLRVFVIIASILGACNSETRLYKRKGGDHLHLTSDKNELFWFNGIHGYDPDNPMFADIKTEFQHFDPDVVLVEGHANVVKVEDELSAIKKGENVYAAFLAKQNSIDCWDIEPPDSVLNAHLIKLFGKEDVLCMYLIRQMIQWGRQKESEVDFEKEAINFVTYENRNIKLFNQKITLDIISELLKPHSKIDNISNENWNSFDAKKYLYFSDNSMSKVYNETLNYRNIYLLEFIALNLERYNRIFIMMGFDHAEEVENEINEIFNMAQ